MCFTNFSSKHTLHTFFGDVKDFPQMWQAFGLLLQCLLIDSWDYLASSLKYMIWIQNFGLHKFPCYCVHSFHKVLVFWFDWHQVGCKSWWGLCWQGIRSTFLLIQKQGIPQCFELFTDNASIRFFAAMRFFSQSFDLYHYQSHNYVGFSFPCRCDFFRYLFFAYV